MQAETDSEVAAVIDRYPGAARTKIRELRALIIRLAGGPDALEETLKWGEPAFLTRGGSTVRLAWSEKYPQQCRVLFICSTRLVDTFRELYGDELTFESNRAIVLALDEPIPVAPLSHCIALAQRYHQIKHLPNLGC